MLWSLRLALQILCIYSCSYSELPDEASLPCFKEAALAPYLDPVESFLTSHVVFDILIM